MSDRQNRTANGTVPPQFGIKQGAESTTYSGGFTRDSEAGKPRYDLMVPEGVPEEDQFLYRVALHLAKGADRPGREPRNWENANDTDALARFKSSAFRHFMQWFYGHRDEDHMAAVVFNLMGYETTLAKLRRPLPDLCQACESQGECVGLC